ncbi:ABC transporter substrate-binding protein [Leptolyngbya sp. 'hensonii']|uniref:ABC transporter substrate-binding protein n=1 Tax=Leptolyngbya sp. 'hensonii' TaxID=1922337 RepID=UPI00209A69B1|nr:ABC transporter substrate-binding protein [Leptolyngbya sp. 'hensonii']
MQFSLRNWRSLGRSVILFCLSYALVLSCTIRQDSQSPNRPGTVPSTATNRIVIGTTAGVRTLDPANAYELWAGNLLYNLGDRLYTYNPEGQLVPQLATALPKVSADGLTYIIPLRQGVVFHDGTPFNAAAMAFSLERFIKNAGSPSFLLSEAIDLVKATGELELTIKLKKPFAAFPSLLAFSGACAVSPQAYEIGNGKFKTDQFVGTGPYKLTQYATDAIRLEAFDRYWGEKPANTGIDIQKYSSSANLYNAFRTGSVDVAFQSLDPDQTQSLQKEMGQSGWQVIEGKGTGIYYLTVNVKSKPLDQVLVRQAVAALIDRPLLKDRVFRGQVEPLYSLIPDTLDVYKPVFKDQYGDGDVAKAQAALSQAGYSKDKPLVVELWYRSNLTTNELAATTLKASVQKNLGEVMKLELKSVESATAYDNLDKGAYPIFMLDWTADFFDPDNYIQPFMACSKGSAAGGCEEGSSKLQGSFYYNDRVNQLIDAQRQETNPEARKNIFLELQDILAKDVPFIPLWQNKEYLFAQKGITGARLESTQKVPFWTMGKG